MFPILIPGWYLVYDVCLTVLLATVLRFGVGVRAALTGALAVLLLACGMIFHPQDPIGHRATDQILCALLCGMLLRWGLPAWRPPRWQAGAIALLGLSLYWLPYDLAFAAEWPMLVSGLPTLIMVGGAIAFDRPGDKPIRWLAWLGDASMSIYIWHVIGIAMVGLILGRFRVHDVVLVYSLEVAGGLALGLALYPCLERPLTAFLLERFHAFRQPRQAPANA
jgi:exopolysaccharide production protein ExoZ